MSNTINIDMKRVVLCVPDPWNYYDQFEHCCIMTVNPDNTPARQKYLLDNSDWSIKVTQNGVEYRDGGDYPNEKIFAYTSGTTGDSKFYSFSQEKLDHCVDTIIQSYNITANDRYVSIMPLWHAHGQTFYWLAKRIKCESHFMSVAGLRNMPKYSPTFITAVPDMLKVVSQLDFDQNLRFVRSASVALSNQLFQTLKDKFNLPIIEAFGMTESLSHCFTNPLHGEQRIGTVGLPSGIEATIKFGQLHIRGFSVFTSDWYNTGDLAELDEHGYYRILGRVKDRINIKGYKIDPISIERQLHEKLSNIGDCIIFGNEVVNCIYTGTTDINEINDCLIKIHPVCRPSFILQTDTIPLNGNGKLSRLWLINNFKCR